MSGGPASPSELFQLDPATCLTLMTTQHVGRLVVLGPASGVMPVNYRLVDGEIIFRTEVGSRADEAAGQAVMFEVDMFDDRTRSGWSVLVRGRLIATSPADPSLTVDTWAPGDRDRWMAISAEIVTGRLLRGAVEPTSHPEGYL